MPIDGERVTEAQDDIQAIDALLTRFEAAVVQADIETIRSSFCEDAVSVFTGSSGPVRGVDGIVALWAEHLSPWSDVVVDRTDTFVRIHADTAWATFIWNGAGSTKSGRYVLVGERWSVVLLWEDGWRFAQTHSSLPFQDWERLRVTPS